MNPATGTVSIAPLGTSPTDRKAWTTIGYTDGHLLFEPDDTEDVTFVLDCAEPRTMTVTMPATVSRQVLASLYGPPECRNARRRIEEAGRRWRIHRLLAIARVQPVVPPCPRPF
ncbi:hypothetical protein ACWGH2_42350 [Streptomyces sp. NPDC054871]